jgi:hypothetical protein
MTQNGHDDPGEVDTSNPWLVIPYFPGDGGRKTTTPPERPLTGISWLCPSIKVTGVGYSSPPGTYQPDKPLSIAVDVANLGVPSAPVAVDLWWADPGTNFVTKTWFGTTTFPVTGGTGLAPVTSYPPIIWTPASATVPPHFCLLARATTAIAVAETIAAAPDAQPGQERHWAQLNLWVDTTAQANTKKTFVFWVGNSLSEAGAHTVTVRPVAENHLREIARVVRAEPVVLRNGRLALSHATSESLAGHDKDHLIVDLRPGERQPLVITMPETELAPHQFTAIEAIQTRFSREAPDGVVVGSLGIVLFGMARITDGS